MNQCIQCHATIQPEMAFHSEQGMICIRCQQLNEELDFEERLLEEEAEKNSIYRLKPRDIFLFALLGLVGMFLWLVLR